MKRIFTWVSWQKFLLLVLIVVVVLKSLIIGNQWLLGWDSVVPELNWNLNMMRAIAGAWQEYQGLGLVGGMAHLADLSRMGILWILNLVVPTQYVRWIWHMGMLVLGPIGIWNLGKRMWKWSESACLVASVFYLLNLATVQYFFVPYEAFSSFYGFLPWLIATFLTYLESGTKIDLWKLAIVGLLATSAFYVQTFFVVYVMVLGVLSLGYLSQWRRIFIGIFTVFGVNAFWLLPIIYGVINGGELVGLAKINSIGSPETALMNEGYGQWINVIMLKGYWLEYIENIGGAEWGRLMQLMWQWSNQSYLLITGITLFGISSIGILLNVLKNKLHLTWIIGLLFSFLMIASFNKPFGFVYKWMVDYVPLFGEMFRSVFTKWSMVLALFVSVGLGSVVANIKNKRVAGILTSLIVVGCVGMVWPVFSKGIVFEKMKVELPGEYLKMFEYMKTQTREGRIAYLPAQDMWSWKYNEWGYRGSGFLWYGLEQPILDRAFDVWSTYNETFYNEFSTALYGNSSDQVRNILDKYDVRYVLLDESVIAPGQDFEILKIDETKMMAKDLHWNQIFQEGSLTVWDTANQNNLFVSAPESYHLVTADITKVREDVVYANVGTYVDSINNSSIDYPFAQLMREEAVNVIYGEGVVVIESKIAEEYLNKELIVPAYSIGDIVRVEFRDGNALPAYTVNGKDGPIFLGKEKPEPGEEFILARVSSGEEWSEYRIEQKFQIDSQSLKIEVESKPFMYDFSKLGKVQIENCDVLKRGSSSKEGNKYRADLRGSACDYVAMKELNTRMSYLMRVRGENIAGRSVKFFLYNTGSKRNDLEYLLGKGNFDQTFSLLPWNWDSYYTLNIDVRSFGQRTENVIEPVEVRWFPLKQISESKIVASDVVVQNSNLKVIEVKKSGTWMYRVKLEGSGLLKLSQGYDGGWIAPPVEHVKVDGWANGWLIGGSGEITIIYWPQLLEYLGFVILGYTIILLIRKRE